MPRPFKGVINIDIRDSTQVWGAFLADKAPEGAPNALIALNDDTDQAAWSPSGGRANMPTLGRLARYEMFGIQTSAQGSLRYA